MDNSENVIILSPDDIQNICRTCLSTVHLESIFSGDTNFSIVNMLMAIADIQISDTDNLPLKICTPCINTLKVAFHFKQQCEEADFKLKEFLSVYESENTETVDTPVLKGNEIGMLNGINNTALPQVPDTDVIVESFVSIIYDKENENLCEEKHEENDQTTKENQLEEKHMKSIAMKECRICKKLINTKRLKEHMRTIHSSQKYQCEICGKKFSFQSNYRRHLNIHIGDRKTTVKHIKLKACPTCGKSINAQRLTSHIRIMHSKEKFQCELCCQQFSLRSNYIRHLKIHTGERPYTCEICGKGFIQAFSLKEHSRVHSRERPYKCKFCDKSYSQSNPFNKHQAEAHSLEISLENSEMLTCQICNQIFTSSLGLNAHSRVHLTKPFHCKKCDKRFTSKRNLDEHNCTTESIHDIQPALDVFNCAECNKKFSSKKSLNAHKYLYHTGNLNLCNFCGKNFASTAQLKMHLVVHSEERPFQCQFCSKAFKTKMTLKVHHLMHTGERPFACAQCNKTFHQAAHLKSHMRIHTGEKPYNCVVCNKNFASKINYTVHMRTHSGETPYICSICNKGFHYSTAMKLHKKSHHKQKEISEK